MKLVVDSCVVVKWYAEEVHSAAARRLLHGVDEFIGPDFVVAEVMNALARKVRQGEIARADAEFAIEDAAGHFSLHPSLPLIPSAWSIVIPYNRNAYDSLCFALALREDCQFVTADQRAYDALRADFPANILWVDDIPNPV